MKHTPGGSQLRPFGGHLNYRNKNPPCHGLRLFWQQFKVSNFLAQKNLEKIYLRHFVLQPVYYFTLFLGFSKYIDIFS
jgi:hypothetical protein